MRHIQIEDGLRVRFPRLSAEFDDGVEVGIAAALMAMCAPSFSRRVATASLEPIRALAPKLGFHVVVEAEEDGWSDVSFRRGPERPRLVLAHSRPDHVADRATVSAAQAAVFGAPRRAELRSV